jgi:hypothetical protein
MGPPLKRNNIYEFSSYLTKIERLMLFGETIAVHFENHTKYIISWAESLLRSLVTKLPANYGTRCSLPCSQEFLTSPYVQEDESASQSFTHHI